VLLLKGLFDAVALADNFSRLGFRFFLLLPIPGLLAPPVFIFNFTFLAKLEHMVNSVPPEVLELELEKPAV
jgi:hypothetical protein